MCICALYLVPYSREAVDIYFSLMVSIWLNQRNASQWSKMKKNNQHANPHDIERRERIKNVKKRRKNKITQSRKQVNTRASTIIFISAQICFVFLAYFHSFYSFFLVFYAIESICFFYDLHWMKTLDFSLTAFFFLENFILNAFPSWMRLNRGSTGKKNSFKKKMKSK